MHILEQPKVVHVSKPKLVIPLSRKTFFFVVTSVILIGIASWSYYLNFQTQQRIAKLSTTEGQQLLAQQEIDQLVSQIKKHLILPDTEKPTLATVTDAKALKSTQSFFEKAQNGDKVLVYVGARKAIVYRPASDLLVNVGFIAVDGDKAEVAGATTQITSPTLEIRNGTQTSGLAQKVANALEGTYTVEKVGDAHKKDYLKTKIVDAGNFADRDALTMLAKVLNAEIVTSLPPEEEKSTSNILIIIGSDQVSP